MMHQPYKTKAVFLEADDIFTLKARYDQLKIIPAGSLLQESYHMLEVLSKILRQCEGRKFEGE